MEKLRLIVSTGNSDIAIAARWKTLNKIDDVLRQSRKSPSRGPASSHGITVGFFTALSLLFISGAAYIPALSTLYRALASIALGAVAGYLVSRRIPHKTWNDQIYELLAQYPPIDIAGYALLQTAVREHGLRVMDLNIWLDRERSALRHTMPVQISAMESGPKRNFLNRKP